MASTVDQQYATGGAGSEEPRHVLALATGGEIGIFGKGLPEFAPTCAGSCLERPDSGCADGACDFVRSLVEGSVPEDAEKPARCEKGHLVAVHRSTDTRTTVFVLKPKADSPDPGDLAFDRQPDAIARLWQHIERLTDESQGLALELINSYEQLNVIFDITRQVGSAQEAKQIKGLLIRVLAEMLSCDWACCLSRGAEVLWWCADDGDDRDEVMDWIEQALSDAMEEVKTQRQILVPNPSAGPDGFATMVGPLGTVEKVDAVVILARRAGRDPFKSGDMQMLDSVLSYGGQVISNLQLVERLRKLSLETVLALVSAIDKKDTYTSGHSERVGVLSRLVGEEMGLSGSDLQDLEWAGILHDVGKIGINDQILCKNSGLTDEEFDLIKSHPRMSYEVIKPLEDFAAVREAVLHHHETPDGRGYPDGLKGEEIPLLARIVHVTDAFDALTSHRSYRRGFGIRKALEIMREDVGTKIDEEALHALIRALRRFKSEQPERFGGLFSHVEDASL